jgi:hypothetical protein
VISPWPPVSAVLLPEAILFGLMMAGNIYVIGRLFPRSGSAPTLADLTFIVGLLLMALGLWFSLIYAVLDPGDASEVSVFIALNSMMAVVGCWILALFLRAERRRPAPDGRGWPLTLAALLVGNELLMGLAFVLLQSGPAGFAAAGYAGVGTSTGAAAASAWFFGAMLVDLLAIVLWVPIPRASRRLLVTFALSAAPGPWVITTPVIGLAATGGLMAVAVTVFLLERRQHPLDLPYLRTFALVLAAFTMMSVGEGSYLALGASATGLLTLGLATIAAMSLVIALLSRWVWRDYEPPFPKAGTGAASARIEVSRPAPEPNP